MAGSSSQSFNLQHFLRNRHAILHFILESEDAKFQTLVHKNINETYHLQPNRMHNMKQWLELVVPIQWRRVFAIDCIPYRELVLEFFSTFSIRTDEADFNYPSILFKLGGVMRAISLREFALRLGIYTIEEIEQGLLSQWHSATDLQLYNFWKQLVDNRDFRVMYIKDSRQRILYQIISAALFGYQETLGDLDHTDIRIMHSILTEQYLCPALYIAKACEERFPGKWNNPTICGGKLVTKLAESYGLLTTEFTRTLEPIGRVFILDIKRLTDLNEPNHKSWVLLHDASPNNSPTQEIPLEAIHTEPTELVSVQPGPITVLESWPSPSDASSSHQGASSFPQNVPSSVPGILSFQELLELPESPSFRTVLGLPETSSPQDFLEFPAIPSFQILLDLVENPPSQDLLDFPEFPTPELPPQLSLEELFQEMDPQHYIYPGESSQQGVPSHPQNILSSTPVVQAQPTIDDLYREIIEIKNNLANLTASTMELKKDLTDLTAWLMHRFSS